MNLPTFKFIIQITIIFWESPIQFEKVNRSLQLLIQMLFTDLNFITEGIIVNCCLFRQQSQKFLQLFKLNEKGVCKHVLLPIFLLFAQKLYILMEKMDNYFRNSSQFEGNRASICQQTQNNNFSNYLVKNATVKYCVASKNIFKRYCSTSTQTQNVKNQKKSNESATKQRSQQKKEREQSNQIVKTKKQLQNEVYELESNQGSERLKTKKQSLVVRQDLISKVYRPIKILNRYSCKQFLVLQQIGHDQKVLMKANKHLVRRGNHLVNGIQEAQILSTVDHHCIIKLKQVFENFDKYLLIFDHFQGICLLEYLQRFAITEQIGKNIIKQVLETIDYLHKLQIIHRDIRAQHIFVSWNQGQINNPKIKIVDFTYAISKQKLKNHKKQTSGAYNRSAPQFLQGIVNNKTDVWSVGILMLVIFSRFSHQSINDGEYLEAILTKNEVYQKQTKQIPEKAFEFINFLMTQKHRRRPSASQALSHSWFKANCTLKQRMRHKKLSSNELY